MAITKTIETDSGLTVENAYIRIGNYNGTKENFIFNINFYKNKQAYEEGKEIITASKQYSFQPSYSSGAENFIKQAYLFLKTLHDYSDAEDC